MKGRMHEAVLLLIIKLISNTKSSKLAIIAKNVNFVIFGYAQNDSV